MRVFLVMLYLSLGLASHRSACGDESSWTKHAVQTSDGTSGQVNTVVATDVDKDGNVDLLASFDGKVILYRGPEWQETVILPEMPADQTGRRRPLHVCVTRHPGHTGTFR